MYEFLDRCFLTNTDNPVGFVPARAQTDKTEGYPCQIRPSRCQSEWRDELNKYGACFVILALIFCGRPAMADCAIKDPPTVPDGKAASEAEMATAQAAVKGYLTETQEFLACLENIKVHDNAWNRKYNDASSAMEKLAADYNKQLKAFKSK